MTVKRPRNRNWKDVRQQRSTPEIERGIARERELLEVELKLASLRRHRGASQTTVADKLLISQSSVSQLERGADPRLSTIASYVNALGGQLEVNAVFPDETVAVCAIDDSKQKAAPPRRRTR